MATEDDESSSDSSHEDIFSDGAHMRASLRSIDPSLIAQVQSLKKELSQTVFLEGENKEEGDAHQEEHAILAKAVAQVQSVTGEQQQKGRRRTSLLKRTLAETYSETEEKTVLKMLTTIDNIQEKQTKHGFKEINFTTGVANCFFVAYAFGRYPEHFWLIYLVQSLYFIPSKFRNMIRAKPLNEAFYYFDFCWMMNFNAILALLVLISPFPLSEEIRSFVIQGAYGISCGPLLGATGILPFVAFIFHDLNTMTNVVIHALPPMMFYTFRWHADEIRQAWPNVFHLHHLEHPDFFPPDQGFFFIPGTGIGSIAGNSVVIYLMWLIPYVSWMLLVGMGLPRKNRTDGRAPVYDTVFHSFWRVGACQTVGRLLWKRPIETSRQQMELDDYEVRDFFAYIGIHVCLVLLSIPTLALACNSNKHVHVVLMLGVLLICIHRGSQRYTYYTTKMYSRVIRKEFLDKPKK